MDPSMVKAARDGDTEALLKLCQDDPLILERIATSCADTPLHIAALLGHLGFIKELSKHKSDVVKYVKELNQHGFSPIHLASENGHVEVVRELLKVTDEIRSLKGKDGMTPIHCACINGRVETIRLLLEPSLASISEVTLRSETALHLAAKNNQLGALEVLVERLKQNNLLHILNLKDEEGNTALHLAAGRRNHQALDLMLRCNNSSPGVLQVNAINESGLAALDLVQLCSCDSSYVDIEILFKHSGAERARLLYDITFAPQNTQNEARTLPELATLAKNASVLIPKNLPCEEIFNWKDYLKFQFDKSNPHRVRTDLLVVAVLTAIVTYLAGLSPFGPSPFGPSGEMMLACFVSQSIWSMWMWLPFSVGDPPMFWRLFVIIIATGFTNDPVIVEFFNLSPPARMRKFCWVFSIVMPLIPVTSYHIRKRYKQRSRGPFAYRRCESV